MKKYYAGIGSRETPDDVQHWMHNIAKHLSKDYILRSGHADGADMAFEEGARAGKGEMEIYLPWAGFNGAKLGEDGHITFTLFSPEIQEYLMQIASDHHPAWHRCTLAAKRMHARNVLQITGTQGNALGTLSSMVICWTKDGKKSGGTGQALRYADYLGVPIFNLYNESDRDKLMVHLGL